MAKVIPDNHWETMGKRQSYIPVGFVRWINEEFRHQRVITHRKGGKVGFCWNCRQEIYSYVGPNPDPYDVAETYEERMAQNRKHGCPNCGEVSDCYREDGVRHAASYFGYATLAVKAKEGGVWFRIFVVPRKTYVCREDLVEHDRLYVSKRGCANWAFDRNWNGGMYGAELYWRVQQYGPQRLSRPIPIEGDSHIYPGNLCDVIPGSVLENVGFERVVRDRLVRYPLSFAVEVTRRPALEQIFKKNMRGIVNDVLDNQKKYLSEIHWRGKTLRDMFRIPTWFLRQKEMDCWTLSDLAVGRLLFERTGISDRERIGAFKTLLESDYDEAQRMLNACDIYGVGLLRAQNYIKRQAEANRDASPGIWLDYLKDCEELRLDTRLAKIIFPQDVVAAHANTTAARQAAELKKYADGFARRKEQFRRKARGRQYAIGDYVIFPPSEPQDLVAEGTALSHCVGTKQYSERHASGKITILFVRRNDEQEKPFFTLSLTAEGKVRECRTKNNVSYENEPSVKEAVTKFVTDFAGR
jgi:hypothetical protein